MNQHSLSLSGSQLKWIALITMFLDHIGACILEPFLSGRVSCSFFSHVAISTDWLWKLDGILRAIGRSSFPLFCFLLVEGFFHTRNRLRYMARLGIFALLSEIPFDLAIYGKILQPQTQNIYFTLFFSFFAMLACEQVKKYKCSFVLTMSLSFLLTFLFAGICTILHTDYAYLGVLSILLFYFTYGSRWNQILFGALYYLLWEPFAIFAFLPIYFYNGKRGASLKYLFYLFYPLHLFLFYLLLRFVL